MLIIATRRLSWNGERTACRMTVRLLALAHEQNCEAALAMEIDDCLRAGKLPNLDRLRSWFAPDPGASPAVHIVRAPLAGYDDLLVPGGVS